MVLRCLEKSRWLGETEGGASALTRHTTGIIMGGGGLQYVEETEGSSPCLLDMRGNMRTPSTTPHIDFSSIPVIPAGAPIAVPAF